MNKRIGLFFFLFVFIQSAIYLFLIPPWQSPDEIHHFGYGALLSKDEKLKLYYKEQLEEETIKSMATFHAWEYLSIDRPSPLPHRLRDLSYFHNIELLYGRSPLYYVSSSFIIKKLKIEGILNQFYTIRFFSLIFYLLSVYFSYLLAKILFKDNSLYCLAVVSFVAFLPQFLIISTSVNPINLGVFLNTLIIYLMIYSLHKGKKLLASLFCPGIIVLGFFTHRAALFMIPPFLLLLIILLMQSLKNKRELLKICFLILLLALVSLSLYFFTQHFFPDSLNKIISIGGIKPRIEEINRFIHYFSAGSSKSLGVFLEGFFKSFWYFASWMRFRYPLSIYFVLKLVCILSFLGLLKYLFSLLNPINRKCLIDFKSFLILIAAALPIIIGTIIRCFPIYSVAQGRYIFPTISAFAFLFVLGLREIVPKRWERGLPIGIITGFIILNIYTLFHALIRVFYYFTNA